MDRRLFLTGLIGAVGTTAIAAVLPRPDGVLAAVPAGDPAPQSPAPQSDAIPKAGLPVLEGDEEFDVALHGGPHRRRRRRRVRRWRRRCRRYWTGSYWRRRCRRVPFWIWIFVS
jgi:hypothetical protein